MMGARLKTDDFKGQTAILKLDFLKSQTQSDPKSISYQYNIYKKFQYSSTNSLN
jgi:hypothetical protein